MRDRMTTAEWVEGMNALAQERTAERKARGMGRTAMPGQTVRVLVRGIFSRPDHKAVGWCEKGEIITVAAGDYLNSLLRSGFVTLELEPPVIPQPDEPAATAAARKLAAEYGVDLRKVYGSGRDSIITKGDIEEHLRAAEEAAALAELEKQARETVVPEDIEEVGDGS